MENHLFIIWETAMPQAEAILEDMARHFEIVGRYRMKWADHLYSSNLSRFYGQHLPPNCGKEQHCGKGAFLLVLVRDRDPLYEARQTSRGSEVVNTRMFDAKQRYRAWTGGGHRIHGTNSPEETAHDSIMLLGLDAERYFEPRPDTAIVDLGVRDLLAAEGWESITDLFRALNALSEYVVLRNFEHLPEQFFMDSHDDIDLLVRDREGAVALLNAKKVFPEPFRTHYHVRIAGKDVPFDLRFVGDRYYQRPLEEALLANRVLVKDTFYAPDLEWYFYSLAYHGLVHKPALKEDYRTRLSVMHHELQGSNSNALLTEADLWELLAGFLKRHSFKVPRPDDLSVYYNERQVARHLAFAMSAPPQAASGLKSLDELLRGLDAQNLLYVQLPTLQPSSLELMVHGQHAAKLAAAFGSSPAPSYRIAVRGSAGPETLLLNVHTPSDGYLPEAFAHRLIDRRMGGGGSYRLPARETFLVLLYHVVFHVGVMTDPLAAALHALADAAGLPFAAQDENDFRVACRLLEADGVSTETPATAGSLLPYLAPARQVISSRLLTFFENRNYLSRVYLIEEDGRRLIRKQTTFDLAEREHHFLSRLDSPYFPRALDLRMDSETSVVDMEFVDGEPLTAPFAPATSTEEVKAFLHHCLNLLEELQARGIAHRDIRTVNVMTRAGRPVLIDFGWATSSERPYPAPGGLGNEALPPDGVSCDVFGMGVLLRMATSFHPEFAHVIAAMAQPERTARLTDLQALRRMLDTRTASAEAQEAARQEALERFEAAGQWAEAALLLEQRLEVEPDHAMTHNDLGVVRFHEGKLDEAIAHLERALELDPSLEMARDNLADLRRAAQRDSEVRCSIIIPVFNKADYTRLCLEALAANTPDTFEVIVVDNASTDETPALLASLEGDVTVIRNETNLGFAKANNQGLKAARGEIVVFLNNDTEPQAGWLEPLIATLEDPAIGTVASKLLYPDGTLQHAGKAWADTQSPTAHPFHLYLCQPGDFPPANKAREFQVVTGACLAMRRADALAVGGFDEGYLNGWEDDDLSMRVRHELGKKVWYEPRSVVIHHENATIKTVSHSNRANQERFLARWRDRLVRDDLTYLLEDGFAMRMGADQQLTWVPAPTCQAPRPRILVANLVRAGDVFLATPIARKIKERYPDSTLTFVTAPAFAPLLQGDPAIDEVLPMGPNDFSPEAWAEVKELARGYDLSFLIQPIPEFMPHFFSTFRDGNWHIVDLYSAIAGIDLRGTEPRLHLAPAELEGVDRLLEQEGIGSQPFVVLHTRSADWQKNWSQEKFARLASHLASEHPELRLVVVGGAESADVELPGALNLAGRLSLRESAALIARARLFVGIDSVCAHLTAQAQTPSVVLFGFTDPRFSRPINPNARCLKAEGGLTDNLPFEPVRDAVVTALAGPLPDTSTQAAAPVAARPKASLVILTFNQLEVTRLCVDSLYRHTRDFELIMVDNASSDGTVAYLHELASRHSNVKLVLNSANRGFAGGCNQGMAIAEGEFLLLLNNDTVVADGWLEGLIAAGSQPGVGLVGPRTNRIVGPQQFDGVTYDQSSLEGFEAFARTWRQEHRWQVAEVNRVIGFCMLIRRDCFERIGSLDTGFGKGNFEDDDYCIRAQLAGFKVLIANEVFIHHFGSVTFRGQKIDYSSLMAENWRRFKHKWHLPAEAPPEAGYRFADVLARPFDAAAHTEPVYSPSVTPAELPDRRGYNLVLAEGDPLRLEAWVRLYLAAFREEDDVALHVLAGPDTSAAAEWVLKAIADTGADPEHIPDLAVLDAPLTPLGLPAYLRAADLVLSDGPTAEGARDMGLPAFSDTEHAPLRLAFERFRSLDWRATLAHFEALPKERWLLEYAEGWEAGLECFIRSVAPGAPSALLLSVRPGESEAVFEEIARWLTLHGHDPEQIPDVVLIEGPVLAAMRQATAWVDRGDALGAAQAAAMGLTMIRPTAGAEAAPSRSAAPTS